LVRSSPGLNPEAKLLMFERFCLPVSEFVPYVFQILSQLLELHPVNELPEAYSNLLGPLLTAALWEQRGNVPALVRLWRALLRRGASQIVGANQVQALLGVFQKLISSNVNDIHGFTLLQALFECLPVYVAI
jgi:exportin-2 (importin alpha re-exporter)